MASSTAGDPPANPMSIELTVMRRWLWWHHDDHQVWDATAAVSMLAACPPAARHVGDLTFVVADLRHEVAVLDVLLLGEWGKAFLDRAIADVRTGRLHPGLEERIEPGPPQVLILQRGSLAAAWRGHGLGLPLLAATLSSFGSQARLAVCRLEDPDPLERIGFRLWNDVHVVALRDPLLLRARGA